MMSMAMHVGGCLGVCVQVVMRRPLRRRGERVTCRCTRMRLGATLRKRLSRKCSRAPGPCCPPSQRPRRRSEQKYCAEACGNCGACVHGVEVMWVICVGGLNRVT